MMAAVDRDDRPHCYPRRLCVDQQKRNSLLPPVSIRIGAHETEAPIGMVRSQGPDLLAVDDVMIAVAAGGGFERGEIGSCARLGKALAPPIVDIGGARQESLFLLVGAELDQHRADHRDVEQRHFRRRRQLVLFEKNHALDRRPARPPIFFGPAIRGPAAAVEDALPGDRILLGRRVAETHSLADRARQVVVEEGAKLIAERQLRCGVAQIHRSRSPFARLQNERRLVARANGQAVRQPWRALQFFAEP
jgi:hypothetical protein